MEYVRKLDVLDIEQMVLLRIELQDYDLKYVKNKELIGDKDDLILQTKRYLESHLNKNLFMFGYFVGDELVANCGFYLDEHFPTYVNLNGYRGYICNVYTKEKYRGRGYQRKTFNECLNFAKKQGIISFSLSSKNEDAINMYKSFGFRPANGIYHFFTN